MKMFSNAWKVCLLLLPMLGSAEEYVVATRLDESLVVPTATMLTSDWTNSVLWLTADSPVLNESTTTATWLDFSPEHNDATQTDTDKQPDRVYTNGAWAWDFDGVDDSISLDTDEFYVDSTKTNSRTLDMTFVIEGGVNQYLFETKGFAILYVASLNEIRAGVSGADAGLSSGYAVGTDGWCNISVTYSTNLISATLNNAPFSGGETTVYSAYSDCGAILGVRDNGSLPYSGSIKKIKGYSK